METVIKQRNRQVIPELTSATPHEYISKGNGITIEYGFAGTPFGECFVGSSPKGICMFQFRTGQRTTLIDELRSEWTNAGFHENNRLAEETAEMLFSVKTSRHSVKLWLKGTPFQFRIWKTLIDEIPFGTVISYKDLARLAGYPAAVRAVASAVARNPAGYLIPCHRVVRSSGCIGQYHWGSERKKAILEWEKKYTLNVFF